MKFALCCNMDVELQISPAIIGSDHRFKFEGREVRAALPEIYATFSEVEPEEYETRPAMCVASDQDGCTKVEVRRIYFDVEILQSDGLFPDEHADFHEASAREDFDRRNDSEASEKSKIEVSETATRAFEYWCRVLRWKSGRSDFGRPIVEHDVHSGPRFIGTADQRSRVGGMTKRITIVLRDGVSAETWGSIHEALTEFEQPPIWIDAYHDAIRRRTTGDIRGAYLEAAISAESFLRAKLMQSLDALPASETAIRDRVEKWGMTDVLNCIGKGSTLQSLEISRDDLKLLKIAFETRNALMHGKAVELDLGRLQEILAAVRLLVRR